MAKIRDFMPKFDVLKTLFLDSIKLMFNFKPLAILFEPHSKSCPFY